MWMPIRYEFWQQINWRETFTAKTAMWRQNSLYICRKNEPVLRPVYSRSHDGRAVCSHHWGLKTVSFLIARQDFHRSTIARPTIYRPSRVSSSNKRDWRGRNSQDPSPLTWQPFHMQNPYEVWPAELDLYLTWRWPRLTLKKIYTHFAWIPVHTSCKCKSSFDATKIVTSNWQLFNCVQHLQNICSHVT